MKVTGSPAACHAPPMKQPTDPAPRTAILSPATIGCDSLVGQPQALRRLARLPVHVDRHSAARIPIAADAQPQRFHLSRQALADADGQVLVKAAMVAEAT